MKVRPLYPDEVKLIEQSRSNNRRAQKQLYDKYAPKMLSVCRYYVKDIHHAEDLLMQGFFKAFTHLHQFGRTDNFEGWLRKIMVREALSFLRKKNSLIFSDEDYIFKNLSTPAAAELTVEHIQNLIDQLPENHKVVFILYAIEGYSHKEISKELKIPVGTSKSYLSRGRNSLQEQIKISHSNKNESI
ncbi:RNA polymerase sigma factor [Flavobacteriaceae bacterium]|nr:RNA polymerase sigma factor [Flavobacteriaceae bacterium]